VPASPTSKDARVLGLFGDKITTDHISPAGSIKAQSPAGSYLMDHGVGVADFNQYGTRRGNHEVMMRGTFANIRIRNHMLGPNGREGGYTIHYPSREEVLDLRRRHAVQVGRRAAGDLRRRRIRQWLVA
jgi:aconitate hydratase